MSVDTRVLLAAFDAQLRVDAERLPAGARVERDGPLLRIVGLPPRGFICYRDLGGLDGTELDALIARQVRVFAERGEPVEWKLYAHDQPADLADRLRRAGFAAEESETVVVAPVPAIAAAAQLPAGVALREVVERADFERISRLEELVWGGDHGFLASSLESERAVDPEALVVVVAEAGADFVCAGWVRFAPETEFATLWGGATLPGWRGQGIYHAVVAYRASLAARRGVRYLQVDASDDSRPILEGLGFVAVTTTTPFVWTPAASPKSSGT